jgi:hypothetical protein
MPPHPEVPAALRRLRDHGFRLFTLTDNTLEISGRQQGNAPLDVGPQPNYIGEDLDVIADQLIELYAAAAAVS